MSIALLLLWSLAGAMCWDWRCRWFGLGFVVYWCIGTPLLFRSYRFGRARAFWHYTTTQHNLWASYYLCLVSFQYCPIKDMQYIMCACSETCFSDMVLCSSSLQATAFLVQVWSKVDAACCAPRLSIVRDFITIGFSCLTTCNTTCCAALKHI